MGEFDGPPLVAGTIHGFRHYIVSDNWVLRSPVKNTRWWPEENLATCRVGWGKWHHVAVQDCMCGFYAYRYPWYGPGYMGADKAFAVIEAYGHVSIGSRGFRAEKARIVALCAPVGVRRRWARIVWVTFALLVVVASMFVAAPFYIFTLMMFLGACMRVVAGRDVSHKEARRALRAAYPDAKVYRSRVVMMLRYLPLTRKKVETGA